METQEFDFKKYVKELGPKFSDTEEYRKAYREWRKENYPDKVKEEQKRYRAKVVQRDEFKEDHRRYCQTYRQKNADRVKAYNNQYYAEYLTDPVKKECHILRNSLRHCLIRYEKGSNVTYARILDYIGLEGGIPELLEYLEINIPAGYSMQSYLRRNPKLTLDHIRPLRDAHTIEEVRAFFHYTNLRLVERRKNFTGRPKKVAK